MTTGRVMERARRPLLQMIRKAKSELLIAAPFISTEVAREISRAALASDADSRCLLTALNDVAVRGGFLSPAGLRVLERSGFEIRSARNLHAKVVVVDRTSGIVGSGNLTTQGIGVGRRRNLELGVVLSRRQAAAAASIVSDWWGNSRPVDRAVIDRFARSAPTHRGGRASGGGYGSFIYGDEEDLPRRRGGRITGLWLKMLYHDTRKDQPDWWRRVEWVSDGRPPPSRHNLKNGPRYEAGDLLVLYLVERGGSVRCCPAVVEVIATPRYDPGFVRDNAFPGDEKQWPWVTDVEMIDNTSLAAAPELLDIGVNPRSTERKGRLVLQPEQLAAARAAIAASR